MNVLSLFSGISADALAWGPLGWRHVAFAEVAEFPSRVLATRFSGVPNLGDVTKIGPEHVGSAIDVLVGGSPCQSFSVAGLRGGMEDARGQLALVYCRLVGALRPRWVVWENVPGVLSSNGGRDFGAFLGALVELGYGFAYRVLDAQFFGLAQRRKRVFVVACAGGQWQRAAAVLIERQGLRGDPPTCASSREDVAGTLGASSADGRGHRVGADEAAAGHVISALRAGGGKGLAGGDHAHVVARTVTTREGRRHDESAETGISFHDPEQIVAAYGIRSSTATRSGDALTPSPDAEGRVRLRPAGLGITAELAPTLDTGAPHLVMAFDEQQITHRENRARVAPGEPAPTLASRAPTVAFHLTQDPISGAVSPALGRESTSGVTTGGGPRRLTPRECERLQGFPDDYTAITDATDSQRYAAIGNSMAVPLLRWLGQRIALVDAA